MNKILMIGLLCLAGCSSTGVLQSGENRFLVSKTSLQVGFGAPTAVHADNMQEAETFCKKRQLKVQVVRVDIIHPALGRPGSSTVEFTCHET